MEEVGCMGTSGNRDSQLASRSGFNDFTDNALIISASVYFKMEITQMVHQKPSQISQFVIDC